MRILITGGAGYIGTTLTQQLLQRQDVTLVRVFDKLLFGVDPVIPFMRDPRYELVVGDIAHDSEALKSSIQDVDFIVHLAAIVGAPACRANPELARRVNVEGTRILNLVRNGQPVIYASTGSNYGAVEGVCTEETPLNPLSEYGKTKTEAEQLLVEAGNMVGYRFATAFGLSPRMRLDLLVNDFCYKAVRERTLILYEAHFKRTFIHVHDIARAIIHAIDCYDAGAMKDQIFNCGSNTMNATKLEVVQMIQRLVPGFYYHAAEVDNDPDKRNYEVGYEKLEAYGFETTVSLEEGIRELVAALRYVHLENRYSNV